jgi:hypothetical protein
MSPSLRRGAPGAAYVARRSLWPYRAGRPAARPQSARSVPQKFPEVPPGSKQQRAASRKARRHPKQLPPIARRHDQARQPIRRCRRRQIVPKAPRRYRASRPPRMCGGGSAPRSSTVSERRNVNAPAGSSFTARSTLVRQRRPRIAVRSGSSNRARAPDPVHRSSQLTRTRSERAARAFDHPKPQQPE